MCRRIMLHFLLIFFLFYPTSAYAPTKPSTLEFPILPSYLGKDASKWLPVITKMITFFVDSYVQEENRKNPDNAILTLCKEYIRNLIWQAFIPGSWTEEPTLIEGRVAPDSTFKIIKAFAEPWKTISNNRVVMIYSTLNLGKLETKEWRYFKPAFKVDTVLMMNAKEGVWHDHDNVPMMLLHRLTDVAMDLNYELIDSIISSFNLIRATKGVLDVVPKPDVDFVKLVSILDGLEVSKFPGKLPIPNIKRLLQHNYIPLLPTYRYDPSLTSVEDYISLVKRIVAFTIQKHIHIIYRDTLYLEARTLSYELEFHLQAFFPRCTVKPRLTRNLHVPFAVGKDDSKIDSIYLYSAPISSIVLNIELTFNADPQQKITNGQFLKLRQIVHPNRSILYERDFSGISSTIYGDATHFPTATIDFKPIILQYLTIFPMFLNSPSPIVDAARTSSVFKDLFIDSDPFILEEGTTLTVLTGVLYNTNTIIARNNSRRLLYSVHVPFVLVKDTDYKGIGTNARIKAFRIITARHVNEPAYLEGKLFTPKPFTEC